MFYNAGMTLLICDALRMEASGGGARPSISVMATGKVTLRGAKFAARCEEVSIRDQRIAMSGKQVELWKTENDSEQPSLTLRASRVVFDPTSGLISFDRANTIDGMLRRAEPPR